MTRLEDLLHSLSTVLLRYHDTQGVNVLVTESNPVLLLKKTRDRASLILKDPDVPFDKCLKDLIKECTNGYPGRKPFLSYILNEIIYLKAMLDKKNSFSPKEFDEYKKQMAKMLVDFRQLLITLKNKTYNVTYSAIRSEEDSDSEVTISLSGLVNTAYMGNPLCNSGTLLTEEVLHRLNMTASYSDEAITALADNICTEHQNALLVPELIAKNSALEERTKAQKATIESLTPKLATAEERAIDQEATIKLLSAKLAETEALVTKQNATIVSLTPMLADAEKRATVQEETIKSLTSQLAGDETRVKELQETISKHEATISSINRNTLKLPMGLAYSPLFNFYRGTKVHSSQLSEAAAAAPSINPSDF